MRYTARLAAAFLACAQAALIAQQPTFRTAVELVPLDVAVTRDGQPVRGLTARDFSIIDNDVPQRVNSVALVETLPVSVVMVLDTSGSMFGKRLESLVDASGGLLAALRPDDRAALITFSALVSVREALTTDRAAVRGALSGLAAIGPTAIRDAVWSGLQLRPDDDSRPLVLVFSDGVDNASWLSASDVIRAVERSPTVIHAVTLPEVMLVTEPALNFSSNRRPGPPQPSNFLRTLADTSGGRVWSATSERDLRQLFTRALDEMRSRYLVTFYPEGTPREGWHDLKVTVKAKGEVRTRPGYFVVPAR